MSLTKDGSERDRYEAVGHRLDPRSPWQSLQRDVVGYHQHPENSPDAFSHSQEYHDGEHACKRAGEHECCNQKLATLKATCTKLKPRRCAGNSIINPKQPKVFEVKFSFREIRRISPIKSRSFRLWKLPELFDFRFPEG